MEQRVVIITGASSGIGKSLAKLFAQKGLKVIMAARNLEALLQIQKEIQAKNGIAEVIEADVSNPLDCKKIIDFAINSLGRIDMLINNAGISMRSFFAETDLEVIKKVMDVNFFGAVYCTSYAIKDIIKNKGSIVGVSSIAGFVGLPGRTGYSASKFALNGFLEALEIENKETGIHVMIAAPGFVSTNIRNTALTADGSIQKESPREESKMMGPEEVAQRIWDGIQSRKSLLIMDSQGKMTTTFKKFFPEFIKNQVFQTMSKEPNAPFTREYLLSQGWIK